MSANICSVSVERELISLYFDPFAVLCGVLEGNCTPVRDGRLIYRDEVHLTGQGSELLTAPFEAFLRNHQLLSDL